MKLATGLAVLLALVLPGSAGAVTIESENQPHRALTPWRVLGSLTGEGTLVIVAGIDAYNLRALRIDASSTGGQPFSAEVFIACRRNDRIRTSYQAFSGTPRITAQVKLPLRRPDRCLIDTVATDGELVQTAPIPYSPEISLYVFGRTPAVKISVIRG